ncbi:F-box/LRR-repeat protein At3g26922-like isoform X2 [Trifolium pratense]|uniref:F-box/LRR-repeat protein At3g26922-like isoform X2 n=1 Tax=Trifolium pratense TaxID=57577 RepID=UPI001E694D3A|nr:F-box/LRR-repeat protein At3g26922-like isoform X2 [Trifolium pratense]
MMVKDTYIFLITCFHGGGAVNSSLFLSQTTMVRRKRQRKDNQNEQDRISHLSDCLLLHILSFFNTKQAVQTSILSKRWINLWKILPTIKFSKNDFTYSSVFREFMSQFLSLRDNSTTTCALRLYNSYSLGINLFQKTIKYVVSHNVKHLQLDVLTIEYFPSCFFSCLTLTSLNLKAHCFKLFHLTQPHIFPNSLNLPSLTTLSLKYFAFCRGDDGYVEPFSAFNMLNTLIVRSCVVLDGQNLRISSAKLGSLTIRLYPYKNFPGSTFGIELYNAPSLHTFAFTGDGYIHKLYGSKSVLSSIKHVYIDVVCHWSLRRRSASNILDLLVELANIESLTITSTTLMVLSKFPDLLKVMLPSLLNLKSLKIRTRPRHGLATILNGMVHLLLQNSPLAKVDYIKYKKGLLFDDLLHRGTRDVWLQKKHDGEGYIRYSNGMFVSAMEGW